MIWKCKNKEIEYGKKVLIMGILNVTPDSFSDGGSHFSEEDAVNWALQLEKDGADIIDIGAQSTRPGYEEISPEEEWKRMKGVLKALNGKTNLPISIDTYFPYVAENALKSGANIINDVSGVISPKMAQIVKEQGAGWIIMHSVGEKEDISRDVKEFFIQSLGKCKDFGIEESQICFDMGIGFGKTYDENLELLSNVKKYKIDGFPLLLGTSRKRVIGEGSKEANAVNRIFGNIAADTVAIMDGADIVRLHDVNNEKHGIYMAEALKTKKEN